MLISKRSRMIELKSQKSRTSGLYRLSAGIVEHKLINRNSSNRKLKLSKTLSRKNKSTSSDLHKLKRRNKESRAKYWLRIWKIVTKNHRKNPKNRNKNLDLNKESSFLKNSINLKWVKKNHKQENLKKL